MEKNNNQSPGLNRDQLLTVGDLEDFKSGLLNEIKDLLKDRNGSTAKQWLRSSEVRKILGVSPGTLQNFRVIGTLAYSKIGGIVFYRYDDLMKVLENNLNLR